MRRPCLLLCLVALFCLAFAGACADSASHEEPPPAPEAPAPETPSPEPEVGNCADQPFVERPGAAEDAYSQLSNFLRCDSGPYALCYYSGADPLPCDLNEADGTGDCQCQIFEASIKDPMYVEIGGILNKCIYDETVAQCGEDGSKCKNMCFGRTDLAECDGATEKHREAVVCDYIRNGQFDPGAEYISTFSLAKVLVPGSDEQFKLGSNGETGRYAGCMTASCTGLTVDEVNGGSYTTCACPLWPEDDSAAEYTFGRRCEKVGDAPPDSPKHCRLHEDQVWSAAVKVPGAEILGAGEAGDE